MKKPQAEKEKRQFEGEHGEGEGTKKNNGGTSATRPLRKGKGIGPYHEDWHAHVVVERKWGRGKGENAEREKNRQVPLVAGVGEESSLSIKGECYC